MLVASFVLSLAFPGFVTEKGWGWIAFFALIPVFAVIRNTSWKAVWAYGFLFGVAFYCFFNYWLPGFHPGAIYIVTIIKGGEMVLLFLALKLAVSAFGRHGYVAQALIWASYAFLAQSWFAGYPYGTICYALYDYLPLIQIADITGIWGIIIMMVLPQAWAGWYVAGLLRGEDASFLHYVRRSLVFLAVYVVLFALWLGYGFWQLSVQSDRQPDRIWRVATVQHNHDSWEGGYQTYLRNFNNLRRLSLEALRADPDIVVWSETAFVPSVTWNMQYPITPARYRLTRQFVDFGLSMPVPLVTGNPESVIADESLPPVLSDGTMNWKKYNTVILFADGQVRQTYRKQHLVPFTEHFPYEKELPWLYELLLANDYNWWEEGYEETVFHYDGYSFSTPICFEDTFGYISAGFVANGADFLLNMSNDVWSGAVPAEVQHMQLAVFRAIENRRPLVRSTNSGISCMVTTTGEVVDPMEPFTQSWHIYEVPIVEDAGLTFYTMFPDLFAKLFTIIAFSCLAFGIGRRLYS